MGVQIENPEKGVVSRIPALRRYGECWLDCMGRYEERVRKVWRNDWPFWYGERSLVGFLAAAIWECGDVCVEEYRSDKKANIAERTRATYLGRGDLYFRRGSTEGTVEFKMHNVGISRSTGFAGSLDGWWTESQQDARKPLPPGVPSYAGMFLRPYIGNDSDADKYDANLRRLLQEALGTIQPEALAWWCPTRRILAMKEPNKKNWVVGVILLMKRLSKVQG